VYNTVLRGNIRYEKPKNDFAYPTQKERILAAVSHGAILIGGSIIIPAIS